VIAQFWNYHAVFYAALVMVVGSLLCIWNVKNVENPITETVAP